MKNINMKDQLLSSINQTALETVIVAYSRGRGRSIGIGIGIGGR
jgi:tRNA(Met) C34 N-acetyltransferase TmcA